MPQRLSSDRAYFRRAFQCFVYFGDQKSKRWLIIPTDSGVSEAALNSTDNWDMLE